jgi:hypothetical protein
MFRTTVISQSSRWNNTVLVDVDVVGRRNCVDYKLNHLNQSQLPWTRRQQFRPKHRNKLYLHGVTTQKSVRRTTPAVKPWNLKQELDCFHNSFSYIKYGKYLLQNLTLGFNTRTSKMRTSPYVVTPVIEEKSKTLLCNAWQEELEAIQSIFLQARNISTVSGHEATVDDCLLKLDDLCWSLSAERAWQTYDAKDSTMRIPVTKPLFFVRASHNVFHQQ